MAATKAGRNTIWVTETIWERVNSAVSQRGVADSRDMERQVRQLVLETLELHLDQVLSLKREERPCYAGTLLRYPGRETSSRIWLKDHQKWVNRETLRPGSRRVHFAFPIQTAERAVECGLVLPNQWIATGAGAAFIDRQRDANATRPSASTKGRPLSDSVLTALVTRFGSTTDGPMASIPAQIISQSTATELWKVAAATSSGSTTDQLLAECLPKLLQTTETAKKTADALAHGWTKDVRDLVDHVLDPEPEPEPEPETRPEPELPLAW
jgi:hypothetical protein